MGISQKRQKTGNLYSNYSIDSKNEKLDVINDISSINSKIFLKIILILENLLNLIYLILNKSFQLINSN